MKPFDYYAPTKLSEAIEILASHNGAARAIAGGTDVLLKMKAGTLRVAPRAVVNIKRIPELRGHGWPIADSRWQIANSAESSAPPALARRAGTSVGHSHLSLGALTTLEEIKRSPVIREHYPALACAASMMASVQIRNLATVGGNLCNAAPSADLAPILIALNAVARLAGPAGERRVPLDEFFTGPGATVLAPGELLVALDVPCPNGQSRYLRHTPRACMDIAVVGVGLSLQLRDSRCESARVALGAVAPTPLRARRAEEELIGGPLTPDRIDRVAKIAAEEAQPIDDVRGSAWYRRRIVEALTRQGLMALG